MLILIACHSSITRLSGSNSVKEVRGWCSYLYGISQYDSHRVSIYTTRLQLSQKGAAHSHTYTSSLCRHAAGMHALSTGMGNVVLMFVGIGRHPSAPSLYSVRLTDRNLDMISHLTFCAIETEFWAIHGDLMS